MKRKLDQDDVPAPIAKSQKAYTEPSFDTFGLDTRLLQAVVKEGFSAPTLVQSKAIPLALEGKDVLVRAKTGSGKTAAYLLPLLELILRQKADKTAQNGPSALLLLPTYELAQQTSKAIDSFTAFCHNDIRTVDLTRKIPQNVQRSLLASSPDIIVATPARAALQISASTLSLDSLRTLAIDEADLVLSYGYEEDLHNISKSIPRGIQTMMISATLSADIDALKQWYCRNPVVVELDGQEEDDATVTQYVVKCAEDEKFLLAFVIFKLRLVKGKCIIFVADIDRCYRLKLFLEQFGVKSCILNSELPVNSRTHVVEEFNKNVYDIIIASDDHEILGDEDQLDTGKNSPSTKSQQLSGNGASFNNPAKHATGDHEDGPNAGPPEPTHQSIKRRQGKARLTKRHKEYGISRGIDFKNVACLFNFDLPQTSKSYTHRLGRTARAGRTGISFSLVVPSAQYLKHKPTSTPSAQYDEETLAKIVRHQRKKGGDVKPYEFDLKQVDAFRYRVNDALRAVTQIAIREARTRELKVELLKSEKLKRHFEENPEDLQHLRHDGELRAARLQPHLKHIPDYLMPGNGKRGLTGADIGFVGFRKESENRIRKARMQRRVSGKGKKSTYRKLDPLKTFNAKGRRSSS
ncbi:ATP-dependent DNA/RNA helicase [Xanthoria calcicola]